jgi:hypothetical protein
VPGVIHRSSDEHAALHNLFHGKAHPLDVIQVTKCTQHSNPVAAQQQQACQLEAGQQQQLKEGGQQETYVCSGRDGVRTARSTSDASYVINIASCGAAALAADMADRYKRWGRLGKEGGLARL